MNKGINLNENDIKLSITVGRLKFSTRAQLFKSYFTDEERAKKSTSTLEETLKKRLFTMVRAGIISRAFFFPVATEKVKHPTSVYYFSPQNQKNLQQYLLRRAQASLFEEYFEELPTSPKSSFSSLTLSHEIGLSDFFLSLELGLPEDGYELACWERTSPISKELSKTIPAGKHKFFFNPDGFASFTKNARFSFYWIEFDNNSGSRPRYERKVMGYDLYEKRGLFHRDLAYLSEKHNLQLTDTQIERARFRVLHITPDDARRDELFFVPVRMESFKMHKFASLTDITQNKLLSPIWMRPQEFNPTSAELEYLRQKRMAPNLRAYFSNILAGIPRVSLTD